MGLHRDLFRHVAEERGTQIDPATHDRLRGLRLAALRTSASISQAVQQLEGQLKAADQEARRTSARKDELDHALDDYHHLIADLDLRLKRLETDQDPVPTAEALPIVPDEDMAKILTERQILAMEVTRLSRELEETRQRAAFAEVRCNLLERQLAVVENQQGTLLPEPELVQLVDPATRPTLTGQPKVLLVDDQHPNLLALEAVLGTHDHEVVSASSGPEALKALLESDDFAVIILDIQMPEMDGYETAAHIKRRARTRDIPIIFLTAIGNDPEYSMRGYAAGAVDFIVKPFDPWALRAKVAVFVEIYLERRLYALPR
ncbi:PleD family two-component system response regulator [Kitasatospora sp. NBC_00374]|uniref:response regulator n=1 Tax=Kitasatospora sp. NBC_00374 TaxID=2975964 RepID=UPI00352CBA4B